MSRSHTLSPQARDALAVLGTDIAVARRARRWTMEDLAERVGTSIPTLRKIEHGNPTVAIGTVFETAAVLGIDLFGAAGNDLGSLLDRHRTGLVVLPARIRETQAPVHDDF